MKYPYALCADLHFHPWSQFGATGSGGVNTRLQIALDEIDRMAKELMDAGGDTIVIAGDIFHVRGSIDPEVFNPVANKFRELNDQGIGFIAIAGNHDLKGKETTELGNAFQSFEGNGFQIASKPQTIGDLLMIPWQSSRDKLIQVMRDTAGAWSNGGRSDTDVIIHAGIDGVLSNMPDHGLKAADLASFGFRRVWAGDYHHAKDFGNGVFSIGASTQQTWGDVGTKAGFWLVYDDREQWFASHAPEFVDVDPDTDPDEWPLIVDGNYVRVRGFKLSNEDIKTMRTELEGLGAKGVNFQVARETVSIRTGGAPTAALTLEASLAKYINDQIADAALNTAVQAACREIMTVVRTAA